MAGPQAHFKGRDNVLKAYEFNNVGPWAILSGRDILGQCVEDDVQTGADQLGQMLDYLIEAGAQGFFQLRIYRVVPKDGCISSSTPYNYSFRFTLLGDDEFEARTGRLLGGGNVASAIMGRLDQIEARLNERDQEPEETEEDGSFESTIAGIMRRPDVENFLVQKVCGLVNSLFGSKTPPAAMAGTSTVNENQQTAAQLFSQLPQDEQQKFDQAVNILLRGDPAIGTNLMKLAAILQSDPGKYAMLCKMA